MSNNYLDKTKRKKMDALKLIILILVVMAMFVIGYGAWYLILAGIWWAFDITTIELTWKMPIGAMILSWVTATIIKSKK